MAAPTITSRHGPLPIYGPADTLEHIQNMEEVTEAICPLVPDLFYAVSQLYYDFSQVEDNEVIGILREFQENGRKRA